MKINYMKDGGILCTEIEVNFRTDSVRIRNHTDVLLDRAFGVNEAPTMEDFDAFIKDRCFPETRDKLDMTLRMMGLNCGYNPLAIAKGLDGRVSGDSHYLVFAKEGSL